MTSLTPWAGNARTHSRKQIRQIADSITHLRLHQPGAGRRGRTPSSPATAGWRRPSSLGMDRGALRPARAHDRGAEARLCHRRQQAGAERRLGRGPARPRSSALSWSEDLGFDLGVTGFSIAEIDGLVEGLAPEEPGDPEDDVVPEAAPRRVQPGRCLAARPAPAGLRRRARSRGGRPADGRRERRAMVFSDPPYNVPIDGHVGGSGKVQAPRVRHGFGRDERRPSSPPS